MADQLVSRRILGVVRERMDQTAVVALQGARAVGKSTVLAAIAAERQVRVLDLDDPTLVELVAASPPDYVRGGVPVCIDEYQRVPELLQAIKAELNRENSPGRFVLTGSTKSTAFRVPPER